MHSRANSLTWRSRLLLLAALFVTSSFASDRGRVDNTPLEAIWDSQHFDLKLQSSGLTYDCQGLDRRLAIIFRAVGARDGMSINVRCSNGSLQQLRLAISVSTPIPASAENVVAATTYTSTQTLASRLRGERLPEPGDLERFPAVWRIVPLAKVRDLNLTDRDCSVLQQLSSNVFPKLGIQVVSRRIYCTTLGTPLATGPRPRLTVKALVRGAA